MKKLILIASVMIFSLSANIFADGGAIGLQLGRVTFGLGGSCKGPIIGIGPSPDNGLPISLPIVPGDCSSRDCCSEDYCD